MKNKAPEEATVRVLPNCTGKVLGSEIGDAIGDASRRRNFKCAIHASFTLNDKPSFAKYCHDPALPDFNFIFQLSPTPVRRWAETGKG
jgi:hypothetical protein